MIYLMEGLMVRIIFFLLILFSTQISLAQELYNRKVGPGILHHKYYLKEGPWAIDVLEIDLTNPYVDIESVKAKESLIGREKTSIMANRQNRDNHWVVAAINADFFAPDGIPVNCQVVDGKLIKNPGQHSVIGFYEDLKPFIKILNYSGKVISSKKQNYEIDGINRNRNTDELILTSVGFSRDSTKMFLFTVDGRQPGYSIGMNLKEIAAFMLNLGAYQAVNLDGGGSTTMVVRNKIENSPSDLNGERPVANALLVISKAPLDEPSQQDNSTYSIRNTEIEVFLFKVEGSGRFFIPINRNILQNFPFTIFSF